MQLQHQLLKLGLNEKEAVVYSTLAKLGWATVLQISRHCQVKRSSIHRIIENLRQKGLVKMQLGDKTSYYHLTSPDNFTQMITQKEKEIDQAKKALSELKGNLNLISYQLRPTEVEFYRGRRGLQVLELEMAQLKDKTVLVFGSMKWDKVVGEEFAEKIRQQHIQNNIKILELTNEIIPVKVVAGKPQVSWTKNSQYIKCCFYHRVIQKETLTIENDIYVLPDSVVLYTMMGEEVVGIKIKSPTHTQLMKQLFLLAWKQAKTVDQFGQTNP